MSDSSDGELTWTDLAQQFRAPDTAAADVRAAIDRGATAIRLSGEVNGDLVLDTEGLAGLAIDARVNGSFTLNGTSGCGVSVNGGVRGDVVVRGDVTSVLIEGEVSGAVYILGRIRDYLSIQGTVGGIVFVIDGGPDKAGEPGSIGSLVVQATTGGIVIGGSVEGDVAILSEVLGRVALEGSVGGSVSIATTAGDGITVEGSIGGELWLSGDQLSRVAVAGDVSGGMRLVGRFTETVTAVARPDASCWLSSVAGARFDRPVHLGDRVSIAGCDFRQCGDLDQLELIGADLFTLPDGTRANALANPPAGATERVPDGEMASIYRQLRVNLEGKGNRPASAFFYRGEMDSRRRAARGQRRWAEWGWLSVYRIVAGYGLLVAPPLLWFVTAWIVATVVFLTRGLVVLHGDEYVSASWWQAASFTLQSMLSVFRPPDAVLGLGTTIVQVTLRLLGPILLGLAALAVRDKVAR